MGHKPGSTLPGRQQPGQPRGQPQASGHCCGNPSQQHRGIARQHPATPIAHLQGQSRGHHGAHAAANAIGTEADATTAKGLAHRMGRQIGHSKNFVRAELNGFRGPPGRRRLMFAVCSTPALGPATPTTTTRSPPQQQTADDPARQPNQWEPRPQQPTEQAQAHSQRSAAALKLPGRHLGQS